MKQMKGTIVCIMGADVLNILKIFFLRSERLDAP